ncbi:helicase associated domain-containing protein [Nakamurella alba]|uniref:helicase associated domain-containing protein n=1 Tax=Nakamurella alba TaxID=2665158 RepID=UPI0018AA95B6
MDDDRRPPGRGSWGFQVQEAHWQQRLEAVASFRAKQDRWPRSAPPAPFEERQLGQWLGTQRRDLRTRALLDHRKRQLDRLLPGWRPL